jgi:hypothetical protein
VVGSAGNLRRTDAYPGASEVSMGVNIISAKALLLSSLVALTGIALISAWVFAASINDRDVVSAWILLAVFLVASLADARTLWRLL